MAKKKEWNLPTLALGLLGLLAAGAVGAVLLFRSGGGPASTQPPTEPPPPANPYSEADFYEEDGFIRCSAAQTWVGIDVSSHQEEIDWQAVKNAGVDYAMIRVAWRGYTEGGLNVDAYAEENLRGATEAGLPVGVYVYSQAVSVEEAREEAAFVLELIAGWEITYPVVFDWEWVGGDARTAETDGETVTACTQAFCQMVEAAGYTPAFYFNQDLASTTFDLSLLQTYDFWLAQYSDAMTFPYDVAMWQYTCTGQVDGVSGDVDINLCFRNYEDDSK